MKLIGKILAVAAMAFGLTAGTSFAGDTAEIIGGQVAPAGKWKFQVGLIRAGASAFEGQFCGGTLINKQFVLTAGHCIKSEDTGTMDPADLKIFVGSQTLSTGGRLIAVSKIIPHPKYSPPGNDYDVAVIKLAKAVTNITPIGYIKSKTGEQNYSAVGDTAYVIGWGDMDPAGDATDFPDKLMQVKIKILSKSRCNDAYGGDLTSRMICAGSFAAGKDSCQGDSGGPLIVANASGKFALQTGVVSFGAGCGQANAPGVYSRLAILGPWVKATIDKNK